ncbi:unnamed protein product [Cylicocyclus nassatus]|uniref:Uncharacterized protein n=1 Tax=Cylicocyclus nassatus TaxID=53992 RepID=A0AA36H5W7_CYLNA|nr:unnamed protein product [Cylicocyclus nassatus]
MSAQQVNNGSEAGSEWSLVSQQWSQVGTRNSSPQPEESAAALNVEAELRERTASLEALVVRLEKQLAATQSQLEWKQKMLDQSQSSSKHGWAACDNLHKQLNEKTRQIGILDYKMRREKENFEKQSLSDRKINKELSKEVMEVTEDLHTIRKLIHILEGTRDVSMLEEQLLNEERILSHLVRGEVKRTYARIQADFTAIVEVEVYDRRTLGKRLQCSLHTSSNYHYKLSPERDSWKGDKLSVMLHFGSLSVQSLGDEIPMPPGFESALLRGTTANVYFNGIVGGDRLKDKLDEKAGRNRGN